MGKPRDTKKNAKKKPTKSAKEKKKEKQDKKKEKQGCQTYTFDKTVAN